MANMEPERIVFPVEYPIKVVGRASGDLRLRVDAVFERHFGAPDAFQVTERASAQANFTALTYVQVVRDADQLQALHADLKAVDDVLMVL